MRKITWFVLALLLCLAAARADAVVLRYALKKNDVARFQEMNAAAARTTFNLQGQPQSQTTQFTQNAVYRETVADLTPGGAILLVRAMEAGKSTHQMPGQQEKISQDMPKSKTLIKMTPLGNVLSARTSFPESASQESPSGPSQTDPRSLGLDMATLEAVFSHIPFPERDVKPNDTWKDEVRLPGFVGSQAVTITFTSRLLGLGPYKGRNCARIRTAFEIPLEMDLGQVMGRMLPQGSSGEADTKGKIVGRLDWQFDYNRGHVVYAEGPMQMTANASFTYTDAEGKPIVGSVNFAMKANGKTWLIEEK